MPITADESNLLFIVLTAGGVVPSAAFVTTVVELLKKVIPVNWTATACRWAAFIGSALLVAAAYVATAAVLDVVSLFLGFSAFVAIGRLAVAFYDDSQANVNSLTGPVEADTP